MDFRNISQLELAGFAEAISKQAVFLWILPGSLPNDFVQLLKLPWTTIWNASSTVNLDRTWPVVGDGRKLLTISDASQDPTTFNPLDFVICYDIVEHGTSKMSPTQQLLERRRVRQLKDKLDEIAGAIFFVGDPSSAWDDILLAQALDSHLSVLCGFDITNSAFPDGAGSLLRWSSGLSDFSDCFRRILNQSNDPTILELKDAPEVKVDRSLVLELSPNWSLICKADLFGGRVTQEEFDAFLNGDEVWRPFAADIPYRRPTACESKTSRTATQIDFIDYVLREAISLDEASVNPAEALRQIFLFSEAGAGTTTLLRQTAIALARHGFPTLISRPHLQQLGKSSLENLIINAQDEWAKARSGRGSGEGTLPFCLIIDTDAEGIDGEHGLPRRLASLNRKIVLIRARQRSSDELDHATDVVGLRADTSKQELLAIGQHLRRASQKMGLEPLPEDSEWEAFYDGLSRLAHFHANDEFDANKSQPKENYLEPPALFLVGIYPFVKERVTDENSLEQYYYRKWSSLPNENIKELVRVLAAAGTYETAVPFDTLRRHRLLQLDSIGTVSHQAKRQIDTFVRWYNPGWSTRNWALYIRNPAIGWLLTRAIDPSEGEVPYSPFLPLLNQLTTKEEDIWFVNSLCFNLGRHFSSLAPQFSLEIDTTPQRAARAIFGAIPPTVKSSSRTVRHQEGRYHIHILHSCLFLLERPNLTTLTKEQIYDIALEEYKSAEAILQAALKIKSHGEPDSYVFNTLAAACFSLADALEVKSPTLHTQRFREAIDWSENAIAADPANGHALFQFVQGILQTLKDSQKWDPAEQLDLYIRAETRLTDLIALHADQRWRNIDPTEAERQIGILLQDHLDTLNRMLVLSPKIQNFELKHPEAIRYLQIRKLLRDRPLREAFANLDDARDLRRLRASLDATPEKTVRTLQYIYRLYLEDPLGRGEFENRLEILNEIRRLDPKQFEPYKHDEAALYCHLDKLDVGARKFQELRAVRQIYPEQWYWLNEKVLLSADNPNTPREMTIQVTEPELGRARFFGSSISLRYQPRQMSDWKRQQVAKAFIRFTMNGFQAVRKEQADLDARSMGLQ